ncbi:MAG: DUF4293 domain-containing protein [Flavobacteriales bacterium]|jgi:hypothetical protein|nr:DUF4293 domain-containing protein [Flavobacteriales bacterium]MDG2370811.1 DUF4293 domain-containing protein [Flavobacteriales bacterium]
MLQRIQTVYLIFVIVFVILSIFFPYATFNNDSDVVQINAFGLDPVQKETTVRFPIYVGLFMIIGVSVASIGLYKNRKRQLMLGKINYLLILLTLVLLLIDVDFLSEKLLQENDLPNYGWGTYFIVCSLPIVFLANRSIKKDEALVKSLDRLR